MVLALYIKSVEDYKVYHINNVKIKTAEIPTLMPSTIVAKSASACSDDR